MNQSLTVYLFQHPVGMQQNNSGKLTFQYNDTWLSNPKRRGLSNSLPLQVDAFDDDAARPFFSGLLPEGELRKLLAQQFGHSHANAFALLNEMGGECAGAVSLWPTDHEPPHDEDCAVKWLDDEALGNIITDLPRRPMLAGEQGMRLSLAGAQDKLPVIVDGTRIGLAMHGAPSTHILKTSIRSLDNSVANEGFCLMLARNAGLPAAPCQIRHVRGHDFLLVERYDRVSAATAPTQRIHQEDFCQALGRASEAKYQHEGGPDFKDCFDLLRQVVRPSAPAVLMLLDYCMFNTLIGNHDAHGKNFSLLYHPDSAGLAPLYDTVCTAVYPNLTPKMAMKIGSQHEFDNVMPQHWDQLFQACGLSVTQSRKRLVSMASRLANQAHQLQGTLAEPGTAEFKHNAVIDDIVALIDSRCATTRRKMAQI